MTKLKKIYDVEFIGSPERKPRIDKSPISEYRNFIANCTKRGISRDIMLSAIKEFDDRFKDYTLNKLSLYCSRMFRRIPIKDKTISTTPTPPPQRRMPER